MKYKIILLLSASLICFLVGSKAGPAEVQAPGTTTNMEFALSKDEVPKLEAKALDGDIMSSVTLTKYYMLDVMDYEKARFWLQIAAENGEPTAAENLVSMMTSDLPKRDPEARRYDSLRSCFWVRKAIAERLPKDKLYSGDIQRCKIR